MKGRSVLLYDRTKYEPILWLSPVNRKGELFSLLGMVIRIPYFCEIAEKSFVSGGLMRGGSSVHELATYSETMLRASPSEYFHREW